MAYAADLNIFLLFSSRLICIFVSEYTRENMEIIVRTSYSKAECLRRLGIVPIGGNYKTLDIKIKEFDLNCDHFTGQSYRKGCVVPVIPKRKLSDILVENSTYNSNKLRKRLISEGVKKHQCEICLGTKWNGGNIPIELDHINGITSDNRLENLRIICPNCHALTPNYRGKNKNKSALVEMREVEYRKFRETPVPIERGNPKPSLQSNLQEGQETRHGKSKSVKIERHCKLCKLEIHSNKNVYCSVTCYKNDRLESIPKVPDIISAFNVHKSFVQVGKQFNVSDNAVRKWVARYGISDMIKV